MPLDLIKLPLRCKMWKFKWLFDIIKAKKDIYNYLIGTYYFKSQILGGNMKVTIQEIDNKMEEFVEVHIHEKNESIEKLIDYIENEKYRSIKLSCYKNGRIYKIKSDDIYFVETTKNTLLIHTEKDIYEYKNRLYELEKMLPSKFIRISKSTILNLEKVLIYNPLLNGLMEVKLINSEITYISRKYLKEVRSRIIGRR